MFHSYKNKKVLVTGHTGFKGSWLSLWLNLLGAEVAGFSLEPDTEPNLFNILRLEKCITSIIGDIRDKDNIENVINKHRPDFVFHLAAQPLVRQSYKEPRQTFETNVMGTVNLLEAVRKSNIECAVVCITSDKCYENSGQESVFSENDLMGGFDPYSASKGAAELVISAYRNSFFNPAEYGQKHRVSVASARAGNVIGGGDWAQDRLIPDLIRALSDEKDVIIRNPQAIRPWQHILECISGYLLLGAKLSQNHAEFSGAWNFGTDEQSVMTVEQITAKSIELWGKGNYTVIPDNTLKEQPFLRLDIGKAKKKLGWKPIYEINEALEKTIKWYKYYYSRADMLEFSKNQIKEYTQCQKSTIISCEI